MGLTSGRYRMSQNESVQFMDWLGSLRRRLRQGILTAGSQEKIEFNHRQD